MTLAPGTLSAGLRDLQRLSRLVGVRSGSLAPLVALGLASSLAESTGIGLVVLFLYSAVGQPEAITASHFGSFLGGLSTASAPQALAVAVFAMIVVKAALTYANSRFSASMRNRLGQKVRDAIHRQYLKVDYDWVRRHERGELVNALATESFAVVEAYFSATAVVVSGCAIFVFGVFLILLSWQLAAIAIAGSTVLFLLLRHLARPARALGATTTQIHEALATQMVGTLQGMRTLRAFALEPQRQQAFEATSERARIVANHIEALSAVIGPVTEVAYIGLLAIIVALSSRLGIPFAVILTSIALLYRLQPHVRTLEGSLLHLAQMETPLRTVTSILRSDDKTFPPPGDTSFTKFAQSIRFENVSFTYSGAPRPSLVDVTFEIPQGQTTAIVGPSGAGKTTIINLLLRLYRPDQGLIRVDGVPLDTLTPESWLERLAVAGQDVELIDGAVRENLEMVRPGAGEHELYAAAKDSGILSTILAMPNGFDEWIGEWGLNLSGGQRQRLGLARALICDPEILILDEATSALDGGLETEIRENIARRFAQRTLVLITHRLETVLAADHLICVEDGRIVEAGPPATLLQRHDGRFARMLRRENLSGAA